MIKGYTIHVGNMFDRLGSFLNSYIDDEYAQKRQTQKAKIKEAETFTSAKPTAPIIPAELQADFARLELSSGANLELCKKAYKRLLKKYHPDKHIGNPFAIGQATEMSARINTSYQRIMHWFSSGKIE